MQFGSHDKALVNLEMIAKYASNCVEINNMSIEDARKKR